MISYTLVAVLSIDIVLNLTFVMIDLYKKFKKLFLRLKTRIPNVFRRILGIKKPEKVRKDIKVKTLEKITEMNTKVID